MRTHTGTACTAVVATPILILTALKGYLDQKREVLPVIMNSIVIMALTVLNSWFTAFTDKLPPCMGSQFLSLLDIQRHMQEKNVQQVLS